MERTKPTQTQSVQIFEYRKSKITFQLGNGEVMINLTQMAEAFPNKDLNSLLNSKEMLEYLQALENRTNSKTRILVSRDSQYITIIKGGDLRKQKQGTWGHQKIAIRISQKLSPEFAVWVDNKIENMIKYGILPDFENPVQAARAWADEREGRILAENKVKEFTPEIEFLHQIQDTSKSFTMSETCKTLNLGFGKHTLLKKFREKRMFYQKKNEPIQEFVTQGYFELKLINGYLQPFITQKGLKFINELFNIHSYQKSLR